MATNGNQMTYKKIIFQIKESYGRVRAYPVSPEAHSFCDLTGSKTLLPQSMSTIASLGYECVDQTGLTIHPSQLY